MSGSKKEIIETQRKYLRCKRKDEGGRKADLEILIEKRRQMVYPVIIFLKKAANKSSKVEFLFLNLFKVTLRLLELGRPSF